MNSEPLVKEVLVDATPERVWKAITDKNDMKQWYFELKDFKPQVGFEFTFEGGPPEKKYLHLCKVTEVIPLKKLTYLRRSWRRSRRSARRSCLSLWMSRRSERISRRS